MQIYKIEFSEDKAIVHLSIRPEIRKTSQIKNIGKALISKMPRLKYHLCDNECHLAFADELEDTELAHAFEHVLIDLIGQKDSEAEVIRAFTVWDWAKNPQNSYQIEIYYIKKSILLEAILEASCIFDELVPKPVCPITANLNDRVSL